MKIYVIQCLRQCSSLRSFQCPAPNRRTGARSSSLRSISFQCPAPNRRTGFLLRLPKWSSCRVHVTCNDCMHQATVKNSLPELLSRSTVIRRTEYQFPASSTEPEHGHPAYGGVHRFILGGSATPRSLGGSPRAPRSGVAAASPDHPPYSESLHPPDPPPPVVYTVRVQGRFRASASACRGDFVQAQALARNHSRKPICLQKAPRPPAL